MLVRAWSSRAMGRRSCSSSATAADGGDIEVAVAVVGEQLAELVAQHGAGLCCLDVEKADGRNRAAGLGRRADREASMAPVGGDLSERHEAFFVGYGAEKRVGSEPGERLSEAAFERRREVADTVIARGAIEAVAGAAVFQQPRFEWIAEAKRGG